ncbi:MAG: arylesterase [Candidatus Methylacidiphilales bacterium]
MRAFSIWMRLGGVALAMMAMLLPGIGIMSVAMAQDTASATAPAPPSAPLRGQGVILVLGDSLAAGAGLEITEAFPALLEEKIRAEGWGFTVLNGGFSGDTTAGGLQRVNWLLRTKVDVLILELGGNDGLRGISPKETRENLQGIIDRAKKKYPALEVIVAGMQMPPNMGDDYTTAFRKVFPDIAEANKAPLIPFLLEGVGGHPELNQPDRIHPTAEGHKIVANNVWVVLKPLLEKRLAAAQTGAAVR